MPSPRFRLIGLALTCVLMLFCAGTASAAGSIAVKTGADPTEEVPLPISVTWASSASVPRVCHRQARRAHRMCRELPGGRPDQHGRPLQGLVRRQHQLDIR